MIKASPVNVFDLGSPCYHLFNSYFVHVNI